MELIARRYLPLLVIGLAYGRPVAKTRLQKIVLRLSKEFFTGLVEPAEYNFRAHFYGGYTPEIYSDTAILHAEKFVDPGALDAESEPSDFTATLEGQLFVDYLLSSVLAPISPEVKYVIVRDLNKPLGELLNDSYRDFPEYAVNTRLPKNSLGRYVPTFDAEENRPSRNASPSINPTAEPGEHSEALRLLNSIRGATELTPAELGILLGVSKDIIMSWSQGQEISTQDASHIAGIQQVISRAQARYHTPLELKRWLRTPSGSASITPFTALAQHQYDQARFFVSAISQAGRLLTTPFENQHVNSEHFSSNAEYRDEQQRPAADDIHMSDLFDMPPVTRIS